MVDLFALCYPALDDIWGKRVRSSILSHTVRPRWDVVDDADIRTKELFGVFLAGIILWGHVDDDGAVLSHCGGGAGRPGISASEKGGCLDSACAIPRGILVMI